MSADIRASRVGSSVAEGLGRWQSEDPGFKPALIAGWICSNPQPRL